MELIVAFTKANKRSWWNIFLKKDIQHCITFHKRHSDDRWIVSEWGNERLDCMVLEPGELHAFIESTDMKLLSITLPEEPIKQRFIKPALIHCVSHAQHLIGHYRWSIITPYQFYRYLIRIGAKEI